MQFICLPCLAKEQVRATECRACKTPYPVIVSLGTDVEPREQKIRILVERLFGDALVFSVVISAVWYNIYWLSSLSWYMVPFVLGLGTYICSNIFYFIMREKELYTEKIIQCM